MPDQTNAEVSDERLREIEPCPFCDGEAALYSNPDGNVVECKFCFCCSPERDDASEAITAWNRRSGTSQASEGEADANALGDSVAFDVLVKYFNGKLTGAEYEEIKREISGFVVRRLAASPVSKRVERLETANRALAEIKESFRIAGLGTIGAHWQTRIDAIDQALQGGRL